MSGRDMYRSPERSLIFTARGPVRREEGNELDEAVDRRRRDLGSGHSLTVLAHFVARHVFPRLSATSTPIYWRFGVMAHNARKQAHGPPEFEFSRSS